TLIFVSPGQLHRWNQKPRITGPMICFTQEFYDGKEPPPSSLLDHSFWFPFETPPLLTIGENQAAKVDSLWNEMAAEAAPSKERDDVGRALLRLLFYKATRIYRSLYEEGWRASRKRAESYRTGFSSRCGEAFSYDDFGLGLCEISARDRRSPR